jgi:hypothetical protein
MRRRAVLIGLIGAFVFAIGLSASPQLHERFHPDANQARHECAVTLIGSGTYEHSSAPPVLTVAVPTVEFCQPGSLAQVWVPSPFLASRIFEHAPPACA